MRRFLIITFDCARGNKFLECDFIIQRITQNYRQKAGTRHHPVADSPAPGLLLPPIVREWRGSTCVNTRAH